jgi:hypothetical protein
MSQQSFIHNPLGRVQLMLLGGPRGVLFLGTIYAAAVVLFLTMIHRVASDQVTTVRFAAVSMYVILFIELTILLLGGTSVISKAVQRDFTSDMITSHRMSAMSGHSAVFGYLTGTPAQIYALTVINWIICTVLARLASPGVPGAMLVPSFLFALFGCTAWMVFTLAILLAVCTRGSQLTAGLVVVMVMLTNAKAMTFVPGMAILLASATYSDMTNAASTTPTLDPWIIVSVLAQLVLGLIFFLAAARRMHRDDYAAFNPRLAYILLAFSALLATVGLRYWQAPASLFTVPGSDDDRLKINTTLAILCLIALLPVANAARNHVDWSRRRSKDSAFQGKAPWHFVIAAIFSTLVVAAIWWAVAGRWLHVFLEELQDEVDGSYSPAQRAGAIVAAFLLALLIAGCVFRLHRRGASPIPSGGLSIAMLLPLVGYLTVYWILPVAADLALEATTRPLSQTDRSLLFTCSPVGTWITACSNTVAPIWQGLTVQTGLLVLLLVITSRSRR